MFFMLESELILFHQTRCQLIAVYFFDLIMYLIIFIKFKQNFDFHIAYFTLFTVQNVEYVFENLLLN